MTVVIGAISGSAIVVASDRMATNAIAGSVDDHISKIHLIPTLVDSQGKSSVIVGFADNIGRSDQLRQQIVKASIASQSVESVANVAVAKYSEMRARLVDAEVFIPRGITLQQYFTGVQHHLNREYIGVLDVDTRGVNLGVEAVIAGVDDTGPQLYYLSNPGTQTLYLTSVGIVIAGSGGGTARNLLCILQQTPKTDLPTTVFNVFAAKRQSETIQGVGHETDMYIVTVTGVETIAKDALEALNVLYDEWRSTADSKIKSTVTKAIPSTNH